MVEHVDASLIAVTFQALGSLMLGLLLMQLGRTFYYRPARLWSAGWLALSIALASVAVSIYTPHRLAWIVYLLGEWTFLFLLWAGCREAAQDGQAPVRGAILLIPIAIVVAAVMIDIAKTFNDLFTMEAAIIAVGAISSTLAVRRAPSDRRTPSWNTIQVALLLAVVLYAAYVPIYALHVNGHAVPLLEYSSLLDLLAGIFLGLSMILLIAETERQNLRRAIAALDTARSEAERRLHVDPLTEVLNRYAFHAMQRGDEISTEGSLAGVVAVFDVDNLKGINDQFGHAAGDHVIRAAASAIRGRVRAEDLLFRMGGDEFLVILPNLSSEQLRTRLAPLTAGITVHGEGETHIDFGLSWGDAEFSPQRTLGDAIEIADAKMYKSRRNRQNR